MAVTTTETNVAGDRLVALDGPAMRRTSVGRRLSVGVAERRAILLLGDVAVLLASLLAVGTFVPKPSWLLAITTADRMVTTESVVVLAVLWLVASVLTDCYDLTLA